jgi:hypothetical protein
MGFSCSTSQRANHPKLFNRLNFSQPNEWFQDPLDVQLLTTQTTLQLCHHISTPTPHTQSHFHKYIAHLL